jgi:hypothetical protein
MEFGKLYPQFDYLDNLGRKLRAYLSKTHFPSTPMFESGTDDPQWYVIHPEKDGQVEGPFDELTYVGEDRQFYTVRVHAKYDSGSNHVRIWLEHHLKSGGGNYDDRTNFTIRDWNDEPIHIQINGTVPNDSAPEFRLFKH